jgi:hypothetical protein
MLVFDGVVLVSGISKGVTTSKLHITSIKIGNAFTHHHFSLSIILKISINEFNHSVLLNEI